MDYFHSNQNIIPKSGDLLISEPYLPDPNFERTVVLICSDDENGSFGYVLNQKSELKFNELIEDVENFDQPVFLGGPVQQNTLHFIHRSNDESLGGKKIGKDLYWGGDYDRLIELIKMDMVSENDYKFFVGYSGWGADQLKDELNAKSWFVYKNPMAAKLFETPSENLWQSILEDLGGKFKMISKYLNCSGTK